MPCKSEEPATIQVMSLARLMGLPILGPRPGVSTSPGIMWTGEQYFAVVHNLACKLAMPVCCDPLAKPPAQLGRRGHFRKKEKSPAARPTARARISQRHSAVMALRARGSFTLFVLFPTLAGTREVVPLAETTG